MSEARERLNVRMPGELKFLCDSAASHAGHDDTSTWARDALADAARRQLNSTVTHLTVGVSAVPERCALNLRMVAQLRSMVDKAAAEAEYTDTSAWARDVLESAARQELRVPVGRQLGVVSGHQKSGCVHPRHARESVGTAVMCRACEQQIGVLL